MTPVLAHLTDRNGVPLQLVRLPWRFYLDHFDRALPTPDIVARTERNLWVLADDPALPELLDDARHYAGGWTDATWLQAPAMAVVKAIEAAQREGTT